MEYAVLLYQHGGLWCAEVPDLDYSGAHAATAESVLGLIRTFIQEVRASYRAQGLEPPAPTTRGLMLDIEEDTGA